MWTEEQWEKFEARQDWIIKELAEINKKLKEMNDDE